MDTLKINKEFLESLLSQAKDNPRLRQNYDLRTSEEDKSQRMLNALMPGTEVAIHRHPNSSESVVCLCGRMDVVVYDEVVTNFQDGEDKKRKVSYNEIERISLAPVEGKFGCSIPKGAWHTVGVFEPSVIFEAKDRAYGEDGSEMVL
jgi:cupin fold WbuC family metalloprotein